MLSRDGPDVIRSAPPSNRTCSGTRLSALQGHGSQLRTWSWTRLSAYDVVLICFEELGVVSGRPGRHAQRAPVKPHLLMDTTLDLRDAALDLRDTTLDFAVEPHLFRDATLSALGTRLSDLRGGPTRGFILVHFLQATVENDTRLKEKGSTYHNDSITQRSPIGPRLLRTGLVCTGVPHS